MGEGIGQVPRFAAISGPARVNRWGRSGDSLIDSSACDLAGDIYDTSERTTYCKACVLLQYDVLLGRVVRRVFSIIPPERNPLQHVRTYLRMGSLASRLCVGNTGAGSGSLRAHRRPSFLSCRIQSLFSFSRCFQAIRVSSQRTSTVRTGSMFFPYFLNVCLHPFFYGVHGIVLYF